MLNSCTFIGRLVRDPELRYTQDGTAVANFTLAVNRAFSKEKEADFIKIITWRKQAENCTSYLSKGSLVCVEGRLQIRSYEDREGIKRTAVEITANNVVFLDTKRKENNGGGGYEEEEQVIVDDDEFII